LHDYRDQVDRQNIKTQTTDPINNVPAMPVDDNEPVAKSGLDEHQLQAGAQERRDKARQASVQAVEIKQTKTLIDTYIRTSSKVDETNSNTSTIEPFDVYTVSLKYSRRADLMSAFEEATKPQGLGMTINVLV